MARQITHGWVRTKGRQPTGYRKALCGVLAQRRFVRKSGFACPMCQAVQNNTVSSAVTIGLEGAAGRLRNRQQGGGR